MLDEIGHTTLMEWVAYCQIEQEEEEAARKEAENNGNGKKRITL